MRTVANLQNTKAYFLQIDKSFVLLQSGKSYTTSSRKTPPGEESNKGMRL